MTRLFRWLPVLLLVLFVAGCGGGGASSSTVPSGAGAAVLSLPAPASAGSDGVRIAGRVIPARSARLLRVEVVPSGLRMRAGEVRDLDVYGYFSDGTVQDVGAFALWSSSNWPAATVDQTGLVRSLDAGSTRIRATVSMTNPGPGPATIVRSDESLVRVDRYPELLRVQIDPPSATMALGTQKQFTATGFYSDGTTADLSSAVHWSSTAGVTVDADGLATATAVGAQRIVAFAGSASDIIGVTVTPAELLRIEVSPSSPSSVPLGFTQQFTALGIYSDGTQQDVTSQVAWSSSDTSVLSVNSDGLATSHSVGSATVQATGPNGVVGATLTPLDVTPARLASLAVTPADASVAAGLSQAFTATGTFTDGTTQDLTAVVTWSSSDDTVARIGNAVGSEGVATALSAGQATITALDPDPANPVSASTTLTVTQATVVSLSVTPAGASFVEGDTLQYQVIATFSDGSTQDLTADPSITWTSSFPSIVSISNADGSRGLATALAAGQGTINAIHAGGKTNSVAVTVTPRVTVQSVSILPATRTIQVGETLQYSATVTFTDGTVVDMTEHPDILFTSSFPDEGYTFVSNAPGTKGLVTALAPGIDTINAIHTPSGRASSTLLTVAAPPTLQHVVTTPATRTLKEGETLQYTVTGLYSDGSTADLTEDPLIFWFCNPADVATISNEPGTKGLLTAVKAGETTVTARHNGIGRVGSTQLTVTPGLSKAIERVNVTSDEQQADGTMFDPDDATVSGDGSIVAFVSRASNLVPGDTNGKADIFVRDREAGTTELISVGLGGVPANGDSTECAVSGNGRYVVFQSSASNLVTGGQARRDVYRFDRVTRTTERVAVNASGVVANGESFSDQAGAISDDGQVVAFWSVGTNLVPGVTSLFQVYVRDFASNTLTHVSRNAAGAAIGGGLPHVSGDGQVVAFTSVVSGQQNVLTFDRATGTVTNCTVGLGGAPANGQCTQPRLSRDGRYVVFVASASNLVAGDTSNQNTFRFDRATGTMDKVDGNGTSTNGSSTLSGDGRYVAYACTGVPFPSPLFLQNSNVWVKDMVTGEFRQASLTHTGTQSNGQSTFPWFSSNGRFLVFQSTSNDLVPGDTNNTQPANNSDNHDHFTVGNPFLP